MHVSKDMPLGATICWMGDFIRILLSDSLQAGNPHHRLAVLRLVTIKTWASWLHHSADSCLQYTTSVCVQSIVIFSLYIATKKIGVCKIISDRSWKIACQVNFKIPVYKKTKRDKDTKTKRQIDKKTYRQKDGKTESQVNLKSALRTQRSPCTVRAAGES